VGRQWHQRQGLGISTIIWLAFTQIVASGLGGYIAGRLRVKWANLHGDEVYFRDTAHGFLAWAVATLVTATLVVGSVSSVVGGGCKPVPAWPPVPPAGSARRRTLARAPKARTSLLRRQPVPRRPPGGGQR
jgi:hypothetical protein